MARIPLSEGFTALTPGEDQILTIKEVEFDEKFNKAVVTFADAHGGTGREQFLMGRGKNLSHAQQVARDVFSTLAKRALRDWTLTDIDPDELVGRAVLANVTEDQGTNKEGETRMYTHVRKYREAPAGYGEGGDEGDVDDEDDDLFE